MTPAELARLHSLAKAYQEKKDAELWRAGILSWKLHAAQLKIYEKLRSLTEAEREVVVLCSRRFGKSFLGVLCALEDCLRNPGVIVRIIGPDKLQTTNIVVPIITKITADAPPGLIRRTKSENKWKVGESELVLGGFDSANIESHRGSESYAIYLEESGSSHPEEYSYARTDILKPQLLHSKGPMIHLTTPPKILAHPFVLDTIPVAKMKGLFFTYTIHDNPLLDEGQLQNAIEDCGGELTVAFRREYLAEIIKDETVLVVPNFEQARHVRSEPLPTHAFWQTVIDFGGVKDHTAAILVYFDFERAKKVVLDERIFGPNTPMTVMVPQVVEMEMQMGGRVPHSGDPLSRFADAPGQTQIDLRSAHGFEVSLPHKDDWQASINSLQVSIARNEWEIHPRCKVLIATLESGTFNKQRTDFARSSALGHMDALAALMYANRMINSRDNPFPPVFVDPDRQLVVRRDEGVSQDTEAFLSIFGG